MSQSTVLAAIPCAVALGRLAETCLRQECETWPKPGLVSHVDSGSHSDMDAALLLRSAAVLRPHFEAMAQAGAAMPALRRIGIAAEARMMAATGGVNTHRGATFALGLLCAAAGDLGGRRAPGSLGRMVQDHWAAPFWRRRRNH